MMHRQAGLSARVVRLILLLGIGFWWPPYYAPIRAQIDGQQRDIGSITPASITDFSTSAGDGNTVLDYQVRTQGECDLIITSARAVDFLPGSVVINFRAEIVNQGEAPSPPVGLVVHDENEQVSGVSTADAMNPGESRGAEVRVEAPDSWWSTTHTFILVLDPDGVAPESNRRNNTFTLANVSIPPAPGPAENPAGNPFPPPAQPPGPGFNPNLLILIVIALVVGAVGVVVLGGSGLLLRLSLKASERKQWEKQAQQGRPSDDCQPSRRYCQVESEIDLTPMHITKLDFAAADAESGQERHRQTIKGPAASDLSNIIMSHWLGEPVDKLTPRVDALAHQLAQALIHFLQDDRTPYHLTISAHLEGIELTSTFTLYQCAGVPPHTSWKKVARWNVKKQQNRDDVVVALSGKSGADSSLPVHLPTELFPQLRDYVNRY